jgi:diaminopimelate decarboxylase
MDVEFHYQEGTLHAEGVSVATLAETYGTPLYVYSRAHLYRRFRTLAEAMRPLDPLICFAVKANSSAAVIAEFAAMGAGADVVSAGEIFRAERAGIPPSRMVFAGVGKTEAEIAYALGRDILSFTVESEPELERISAVASRLGVVGRVDIRVNPDVDPRTHKYTSTGKGENKFGVDLERARRAYALAARLPGLEIAGMHMHLGSPIMEVRPYAEALAKVVPLCRELQARYPTFRHLDIGGGLGIAYRPDQADFDLSAYAETVIAALDGLDLRILLEPGRSLTGNAGILVTQVQYLKDNPFRQFVIADAGMNDLIRPALYQAYHHVVPVRAGNDTAFGDLVGPVCESGDFLAQERDLPVVAPGDYLAVLGAGAYGYVMASNYNSRGRPAEVMVSGDRAEPVRARETWEDLVRGESLPDWSA